MADTKQTKGWTRKQAIVLSGVCLLAGIAGGWSIRTVEAPGGSIVTAAPASPTHPAPAPAQLKRIADAQAAPLLNQLKGTPGDPDLLTRIGNLYYDAQQYPVAVDYYGRVLKARPSDAAVRTDMATAYWYMGNSDAAIAEFNTALTYAPANPNTLFNLGLVKWRGKNDAAGAIADWQKLLKANPNYESKDKVEQMMAEASQQSAASAAKAN